MKDVNSTEKYGFSEEEWKTCLKVLKALKDNPFENPDNQFFGTLITKIHKNAKKQLKRKVYEEKKAADLAAIRNTTLAKNALKNTTLFDAETPIKNTYYTPLQTPRNCYSCNQPYQKLHSFYHKLCPSCAEIHFKYRFMDLDLSNRKVILTGGRVKVGYATALKLLRSQAEVIITTRFPSIALEQFQKEKDYSIWQHRLEIYGLDLRNLKAVQSFIEYYQSKHSSLDILINNAAQTIQYDLDYYHPLIKKEQQLLQQNSENQKLSPNPTPILNNALTLDFEAKKEEHPVNRFGQPIDNRMKNSWNSTLQEISTYELLEVNLINHISPYLLIKEFTPLLKASSFKETFIVNVTSSEGQFSYKNKTIFHPHTNMTKAALNMLTRTSAEEYAQHGIYMNSVDVGWISTGAHEVLRKKQFEVGYIPPLDSVDGAARILHPIFEMQENQLTFIGKLLKNFRIENW